MTSILDRVGRSLGEFRPETTAEFFALQLARKLGDAKNVRVYVNLMERFSEEVLLGLYREVLETGGTDGIAERFHIALRRWARQEGYERSIEIGCL